MTVTEIKHKFIDMLGELVEGDLSTVNTCEIGELVDMIKDLSEVEYYETKSDAKAHGMMV